MGLYALVLPLFGDGKRHLQDVGRPESQWRLQRFASDFQAIIEGSVTACATEETFWEPKTYTFDASWDPSLPEIVTRAFLTASWAALTTAAKIGNKSRGRGNMVGCVKSLSLSMRRRVQLN